VILLQIPHTAIRPALSADEKTASLSVSPEMTPRQTGSISGTTSQGSSATAAAAILSQPSNNGIHHHQQLLTSHEQPAVHQEQQLESATVWSSADRLNLSIGLLYALCNLALEVGAVAGFCVPRPQLLKRWLQVCWNRCALSTALLLTAAAAAAQHRCGLHQG
jgi:hypothetical protein